MLENTNATEEVVDLSTEEESGNQPLVREVSSLLRIPPDLDICIDQPTDDRIYMAMDIGSTTQRMASFAIDLSEQTDIVELETTYNQIMDDESIANCDSASRSIADNLEMEILCTNPGPETYIKQAHIVKGTLMRRLNKSQRALTADTSKVDATSTYINVICNAAIMTLLLRIRDTEQISSRAIIDITASLPPDDANLKSRTNSFKDRLVGDYEVCFPRLGTTVFFSIQKNNITTGSEPLGAALYQIMEDAFDVDQTCIFLDCGGRSSGAIAFVRGLLMEASSYSFSTGGISLLNTIADRLTEQEQIQRPRVEAMLQTLDTGVYKYGGKPIEALNAINSAKTEIAEPLYVGLSTAISLSQLNASDIEHVYCSGRTFGETTTKSGVSPSICNNLKSLFAEKSPNTEFVRVTDSCAVVKGMMYVRLRAEDR